MESINEWWTNIDVYLHNKGFFDQGIEEELEFINSTQTWID